MKNVTINMDEETAREASIAAARKGKSLSRFVGDVLANRLGTAKRGDVRHFLDGPLWDLCDDQGRLPRRDKIFRPYNDDDVG